VSDASGGQLPENAFVPETGWTAQINLGGIITDISSPNHESDGIWSMGCMSEQELKKRSRKRTSNNRTTTGFRISDELWAVLQPLLPLPLNTHRFGSGRPRVPDRRCAYEEVRDILREFGFTTHIRARGEEAKAIKTEAGFKARRWVVERAHSWMNRFRRLLVRWDKKPENYLAFLHFACGLIAFRAAGLFG